MRTPSGKSFVAWLVVLFHLAAALYLAWPTAHHSYDAVAYSLAVDHAIINGSIERLFHQYHVIYNGVGFLAHQLTGPLGFHPIMTFQALNAICGAALLTLLAGMLHARTRSHWLAIGGALMLGGSGSFWFYSTNAEPYIPSTLALFAALALLPLRSTTSRPNLGLVLSALLFALAVAIHLSVVVLAPVWAAFLVLAHGRPGWRRAGIFLALAGAVAALPYLFKWIVLEGHGVRGGISAMWYYIMAPKSTTVGLFFLTHAYNPLVEFKAVIGAMAPGHPPFALLPIALTLLGAAGGWWALGRRDWSALLPFVSFVVLLLFFTSYNQGSRKFTVFMAAFLVQAAFLGLAELIRRWPAARPAVPAAVVSGLLLGLSSFTGYILPRTVEETNPSMIKALAIKEATGPDDAVMIVGAGREVDLKVYVPYFATREPIILDFLFDPGMRPNEYSALRVRQRIERVTTRGGTVWVVRDIVHRKGDFAAFSRRNQVSADHFDAVFAGFNLGRPRRLTGSMMIYPLAAVRVTPDV